MFDTLNVIHGLVTRGSPRKTKHVSPHRRAGLTKLRVPVLAAPKWQPSLSPFTYEGFCVCRTQITPQSGLANGPEWAALKKHYRMRTTDACVPDLVEVLEQEWWDCDNALAPIPMNRPSVALGDRDDR
jgi:hypothetical protein